MFFATCVRTWCVARLYSVQCSEIALSQKLFRIEHMYIYIFLLRMINTVTSQNIEFLPGSLYIAFSDQITVNNKLEGMWKKYSWPSLRYYTTICWRVWGKPLKTSVRIAGAPTEIQARHLWNTSQKHCHRPACMVTFLRGQHELQQDNK
jgi:hypothetical protein